VSGALVVVATPIGNLGDTSERAIAVLADADAIYAEDTRRTRQLLSAKGVRSGGRLVSLNAHNEASRCADVVGRVASGETVALVTDAGTPGVSDPGSRVVAAVADAGYVVSTVPGPSAVLAALSVSGFDTARFCVEGFLPRRGAERRRRLAAWDVEERTVVVLESPQRIAATLTELAEQLGERRAVVARELTKLHEEVLRGTLSELAAALSGDVLGEVAIVIEGAVAAPTAQSADEEVRAALAELLARGATTRDAASEVATALHASRRRVYELALTIRQEPRE
jgi:16S rRNA (cytidine1402-2'-O)-methyltransferase